MTAPAIEGGAPVREAPLPFHRAAIGDEEIRAVTEVLESGWLTLGPRTEAFEEALGRYLGVPHVVAMSSCSEAMLVALRALGVGPGDEVITSSLTFASTVHAIVHAGARPVLVDIETETFGPDPEAMAERVTERTRALLPVHFGGQACRIDDVLALARARGLVVVEDAAHAFGARVDGRAVGTFGDATAFSFYATKNVTTGEGGALALRDGDVAERVRRLSFHGMSRDAWTRYTNRGSWYYEVEVPGYKSNLNDILAAIGCVQVERADALAAARRRVARRLLEGLRDNPHVELPATRRGNEHSWHLFVLRLRPETLRIDRDRFIEAMAAEGIGTSVHFIPIHHHPFWEPWRRDDDAFPRCEAYFERCVSLPVFPGMTEHDCDDVVAAVDRITRWFAA